MAEAKTIGISNSSAATSGAATSGAATKTTVIPAKGVAENSDSMLSASETSRVELASSTAPGKGGSTKQRNASAHWITAKAAVTVH
jgi:hypothetical protein